MVICDTYVTWLLVFRFSGERFVHAEQNGSRNGFEMVLSSFVLFLIRFDTYFIMSGCSTPADSQVKLVDIISPNLHGLTVNPLTKRPHLELSAGDISRRARTSHRRPGWPA